MHRGRDDNRGAGARMEQKMAHEAGGSGLPLLRVDEVLRGRIRVTRMIGGGGFGQVYRALDLKRNVEVAIKAEPATSESRRMILEQVTLCKLRDQPHFPRILASGRVGTVSYIVMQLLGKSLSELRRKQPNRRFGAATAFRIGQQAVDALRQLHQIGFIHRDIKPSNMCIGASATQHRTLYVIDFGMVRQIFNDTGGLRRARPYAGFRGTMRYVSLRVHRREEQGPVDDMWGLFYTLVELVTGELPWKALKESDDVYHSKMNTPLGVLCQQAPLLVHFAEYLNSVSFDAGLDYALLTQLLADCVPPNVTDDTPFDWEIDSRSCHSHPASSNKEMPT